MNLIQKAFVEPRKGEKQNLKNYKPKWSNDKNTK